MPGHNSTTQTETNTGGVGLAGLLGCIFITLKLCGVIDWSWWWVLAPFWAIPALLVAFLVCVGLLIAIFWVRDWFIK